MYSRQSWKAGTSALLALAVVTSATIPLATINPASAQLFPRSGQSNRTPGVNRGNQTTIRSGVVIPVRYEEGEKIVVSPKEKMPLTLKVAANITNRNGTVLIPAGSLIEGELRPAEGGSYFVARELVNYRGYRQPINATSEVIETTQVGRGPGVGSILQGAVIGAGAAAIISEIFGGIDVEEVLAGAGVGAAGGAVLGRRKAEVVVIDPETDLDLTLGSSLAVRY